MTNWDDGLMLRLAAEGLTNREIAHHMGLKHQTGKNRFHLMLRRLGAKNRLHAFKMGVADGSIRVERKGR